MGRSGWNAPSRASLQQLTPKHALLPSVTSVKPLWPLEPFLGGCPIALWCSPLLEPAAATFCHVQVLNVTAL